MVSSPRILTAILARLTKFNTKWAGSSSSTPTTHLEMSLFCCSCRPDQTRHAQPSNSSNSKTTPLRNLYGGRNDFNHMLHFHSPLMPPLIQRSFRRRCRLPLVALSVHLSLRFSFSRALRSFKSFMPLFESSSSTLFSRFCCCTTIRFYSRFLVPSLSGPLFYLLSMHMITPHPFLWTLQHRLRIRSLHT